MLEAKYTYSLYLKPFFSVICTKLISPNDTFSLKKIQKLISK